MRLLWPAHGNIVGLYLDPPEHALVLCCDEKTQIQALDRTQPGLPLKRGREHELRPPARTSEDLGEVSKCQLRSQGPSA